MFLWSDPPPDTNPSFLSGFVTNNAEDEGEKNQENLIQQNQTEGRDSKAADQDVGSASDLEGSCFVDFLERKKKNQKTVLWWVEKKVAIVHIFTLF